MAISAQIYTDLAALQSQINAAAPLTSASRATVTAIQLNTENLLTEIAAAQNAAAGVLDTWIAPTDPAQIISGVLGLTSSATDQWTLTDMLAFAGRANLNLEQL